MITRWRRAAALGGGALVAFGLFVSRAELTTGGAFRKIGDVDATRPADPRVVPADWKTYPVLGRVRGVPVAATASGEGARTIFRETVGDVVVEASEEQERCEWGGSACQGGGEAKVSGVRVGDLDRDGRPRIAVPFECTRFPSDVPVKGSARRWCAADSFVVRRSPDERLYVLTTGSIPAGGAVPEGDDTAELPLVAFVREVVVSPSGPPRVPRAIRTDALILVLADLLFVLFGGAALALAWPFVRAGGVLTWREGRVVGGRLEQEGESPLAIADAPFAEGTAVLVDPEAVTSPGYREDPSLDERRLHVGSAAAAEARSRRTILVATAFFVLALAVSVVGLLAYASA